MPAAWRRARFDRLLSMGRSVKRNAVRNRSFVYPAPLQDRPPHEGQASPKAPMRIAFLYNAQDHHLLHSLPIACELLRVSPEHEVVVFGRNAAQLGLIRRFAAFYPGHD